jgi:hypothetical protein
MPGLCHDRNGARPRGGVVGNGGMPQIVKGADMALDPGGRERGAKGLGKDLGPVLAAGLLRAENAPALALVAGLPAPLPKRLGQRGRS